jgi:WD40 repeat protein
MNMCTASDSNEQDGIASNGKMVAMAWSSQASVAVFNATK